MIKNRALTVAVITAVVLSAVLPFVRATPVQADVVTFYPTVDSRIEEANPTTNYGIDGIGVSDLYELYSEQRVRTCIKLDNESAGGNFSEVLLKVYYYDYFDDNPSGRYVRAYRLTDSFEEYEVTWTNSEDGDAWTSAGGDYSTSNYAQTTIPASYGWVTFNVTAMAQYAWQTLGQDLYVLIRFRYENKDADSCTWVWFEHCESGATTLRPYYTVNYTAVEQTPTVAHTVDEYGDDYIDLEITPTLYDYTWGVVYAQASLNASGNYTIESAGLNVSADDPVIRSITGLNYSTLYSVRAKMVYNNGTVYSNATNVTTMSYTVPSWTIDVDDLMVTSAQVYAGWTNNNDTKTVYARIAYRDIDTPTWTYTAESSSALTANEFNWAISGLAGGTLHYYKGVYTIDGYTYESDVGNFTTLEYPVVLVSVNQTDLEFAKFNVDYYCNGADEVDLSCRIMVYGEWGEYTYSDERDGLTGNGTEYFTFNDLIPQTHYTIEAIGEYAGGSVVDSTLFWTSSIDTYPALSNLSAQFIEPYTLRLSMNVVLNDVEGMDAVIRFWLQCYPFVEGDEYFATPDESVATDGVHYIDVTVGDFVDWDWQYSYYGEIDYISGANQTEVKILSTPGMGFYVMTLQPELMGGSSVKLNGWRQMGECYTEDPPDVQTWPCCFVYWKTGDLSTLQQTTPVDVAGITGSWSTTITGLVYGQNYSYRAEVQGSCGDDPYGDVVTFVVGQGSTPTVPSIGSVWAFLWSSTPGHWLMMVLAMGFVALVFFRKHKTVAVILCLMVLGFGIVIGWVDVWIIVLLAIGGGLYIWRKVVGGRQGSSE